MQGSFLDALNGKITPVPPIWLMRQAGRYLAEYRELRTRADSFMDFCFTPALAVEATLQPIRRFGFDAAIIFSDILVIPHQLGQKVSFEKGIGPQLDPISAGTGLSDLAEELDLEGLSPVFEAISTVRSLLPRETGLIGFCGAPWTVASYMIAGRGTPDQAPARLFAYRHPEIFSELIERLIRASVAYLSRQIEAGADAVQIFDSWAGVLPVLEFDKWSFGPVSRIAAGVKAVHPDAKVIAFPRGAGVHLERFAEVSVIDCLGLDTSVVPEWAAEKVQSRTCVQGNLDPLVLAAGGYELDRSIDVILETFGQKNFIFNLGHGIIPETPVAHVERLVARVRGAG